MSSAAASPGSHNNTIHVCGDNNTVSICQRPAVTLWASARPPHPQTRPRTRSAPQIRRQLAVAQPNAFLPALAASLGNYALRLSEIGQREAALEPAREASDIYCQLAAARPDAFLPDLARSLATHATIAVGPGEAAPLFHAALQTLLPQFLKLPHAHAQLMRYVDLDLLQEILPVFEKLNAETQQPEEDPS